MLVGMEFKRTKITHDDGRTVWYWRVAPYTKDVDSTKITAFVVVFIGTLVLSMLPSCAGF